MGVLTGGNTEGYNFYGEGQGGKSVSQKKRHIFFKRQRGL